MINMNKSELESITYDQLVRSALMFLYQETTDLEDSEMIFNKLDLDTKLAVIDLAIEEQCMLAKHELKFLVQNVYKNQIYDLFEIAYYQFNGEYFDEDELKILGEDLAYEWFDYVREKCIEEDDLKRWKTDYEKQFIKFKKLNRDKKIDQILED